MTFGHLHIKNEIGVFGENAAVDLLKNKGFRILERNWKMGHLEVDIIAEDKTTIAFVEVKTRTSVFGKRPEEFVDKDKRHHMVSAANVYIKTKRSTKAPRFDVIGILTDKDKSQILEIEHYEGAFIPKLRAYGVQI